MAQGSDKGQVGSCAEPSTAMVVAAVPPCQKANLPGVGTIKQAPPCMCWVGHRGVWV